MKKNKIGIVLLTGAMSLSVVSAVSATGNSSADLEKKAETAKKNQVVISVIDSWVYGEPGHGYTVAYYKKENGSYVHKHSDKGTIVDNGRRIATSWANGEGSWKLVITDIVNKSTATFTWDQ